MNSATRTSLLVAAGAAFAALWLALHLLWASLAMMGSLMANDAGRVTSDGHVALILGVLAGQILEGAAGIPAGLAFFWHTRRKLLLRIFLATFLAGALGQAGAFWLFARAAGSDS